MVIHALTIAILNPRDEEDPGLRDPAGVISRNLPHSSLTHLSLPVDGGRRVSGGGAVEADGGALARRDAPVARHRMNPRGDCKKGEGGRVVYNQRTFSVARKCWDY